MLHSYSSSGRVQYIMYWMVTLSGRPGGLDSLLTDHATTGRVRDACI